MRVLWGAAVVVMSVALGTAEAAPLLPDLIVQDDDLANNDYKTNAIPGHTVLRFQSSLPNIGLGDLYLKVGEEEVREGLYAMRQRITNDDATFTWRDVDHGMLYNPVTWYMNTENWIEYRIREVLPGDGIGDVLRLGHKIEIALTSSRLYDNSLPNYKEPPINAVRSTGQYGISIGWTDLYPKTMHEQWVDVTGLPEGDYWLEVEVNMDRYIEESDYTNNTNRLKIHLAHASLPAFAVHRADTGAFGVLGLNEILRVIQLFNAGRYGCEPNTEDGFAAGGDYEGCQPHSSDYAPADWTLSLSELLRTLQFFNVGGYVPCENGEDGYCPQSR